MAPWAKALTPKPEALDKALVTVNFSAFEVIKQTPPLANHHQQATAGVVIFFVGFQVISQIIDPFGQYRYLDFWRTCVAFNRRELANEL
jgi:hypothetical protein